MGNASNAMAAIGFGPPKAPPHDSDEFVAVCVHCGHSVGVAGIASLPDEISLPCTICGHRGIYQTHQPGRAPTTTTGWKL
jgi:hypothetical protein